MVDSSSEVSWFEEVYAVQVRDVHSPLIGWWAVRAVLLHVHAKKTHFCSIYILECKESFQSVWEGLSHLSTVNKSKQRKQKKRELREQVLIVSCLHLSWCFTWIAETSYQDKGFQNCKKTFSQSLKTTTEITLISCLAWPPPPCLRHGPYGSWPHQTQDGSAS